MNRQLVPEMEARRHLLEPYRSVSDVPPGVDAQWKAPYGPPEEWKLDILETTVDGPNGPVALRVYTPTTPAPQGGRPGLVWMHGGAFAWGDLDMPEAHEVARGVAGRADAVVVSVDYRLCPVPPELGGEVDGRVDRHGAPVRFPVPHDDCVAAFEAVLDDPSRFGVDADRLAVGGASAGANLAAAVTRRLARQGRSPWQALLVYPMVHPRLPEADAELAEALAAAPAAVVFAPPFIELLHRNLFAADDEGSTPDAYAGLADDLSDFPPTYVENCEFDSLRASGHAFAEQLRAAGVDVHEVTRRGVPHGHLDLVGFAPAAATLDALAARLTER